MKPVFKLALLGMALTLGACSTLESDKVDYRSTGKAPSLDIPPDLTQLSKETRYSGTGGSVSASGYRANQNANEKTPVAALEVGDVRIERSGNQRWLVINRPAEKLWEPVKDFWQENGFLLAIDQNDLGIMETDWAENRAKIPQDAIRSALGKLLDSFYSTPERDKFRTRLERNAEGNTEIFISHRGMIEVYTSERGSQTVWQPRPTDPELEAEFLRRLMIKLGVQQEKAKTLVAATPTKSVATISTADGVPALMLGEGFDKAWRRVGLALDRTGFTVEDRDRKNGIYFVRYAATPLEGADQGLFSRLFGGNNKTNQASKFQIAVRSQGEVSNVTVLNAEGKAEQSDVAQRIVKVLADDIR